ncbi:MAG: thioredoxin [Prolixibacteraceae bacterium]
MNVRFLNIIKSSKPVIVDFYADWCDPCREILPILKEVKQELKHVRIVKVNVDKNPFIASSYNVQKIPTVIVFKDGIRQYTKEGVCEADELKSVIRRQLNGD